MRIIAILSLLLFLTTPAFSELTKEDLQTLKEDLRTIIKEEIAASEKRTREYIDLKIDGLDKSLNAKIDAVDQRIDDLKGNVNRADRSRCCPPTAHYCLHRKKTTERHRKTTGRSPNRNPTTPRKNRSDEPMNA